MAPLAILPPMSLRNSTPPKVSASRLMVSGWAMVPSKSLKTATLRVLELESLMRFRQTRHSGWEGPTEAGLE